MSISVLLGLPVDASPWAVFEELDRRGYSVSITPAPCEDGWLRAEARRGQVIHAAAAETIAALALELAAAVAGSPWES